MDWYIFLTPLLLLPIIFLFRLVGCGTEFTGQIDPPRDGDDGGSDLGKIYTLMGPDPNKGEPGVASKEFKVTFLYDQTDLQSLTVWPNDGDDGGTFAGTGGDYAVDQQTGVLTFQLSSSSPSGTFTYTPASTGIKTIATENGKGADNPQSIKYSSEKPTPPMINITLKLILEDAILPLVGPGHTINPIHYIWPKFTIDDGEAIRYAGGSPQQMFPQPNPAGSFPEQLTIASEKVPRPAGNHTCSCDVYITRDSDLNPDNPSWTPEQHLIGPQPPQPAAQTDFQSDIVLTFKLNYTPPEGATDYLSIYFSLTPPQPIT